VESRGCFCDEQVHTNSGSVGLLRNSSPGALICMESCVRSLDEEDQDAIFELVQDAVLKYPRFCCNIRRLGGTF
jgi:hypothetical protein